jgi:hypothetical protein
MSVSRSLRFLPIVATLALVACDGSANSTGGENPAFKSAANDVTRSPWQVESTGPRPKVPSEFFSTTYT